MRADVGCEVVGWESAGVWARLIAGITSHSVASSPNGRRQCEIVFAQRKGIGTPVGP
jgi:hypothetical protein